MGDRVIIGRIHDARRGSVHDVVSVRGYGVVCNLTTTNGSVRALLSAWRPWHSYEPIVHAEPAHAADLVGHIIAAHNAAHNAMEASS